MRLGHSVSYITCRMPASISLLVMERHQEVLCKKVIWSELHFTSRGEKCG